MEVDKVVPTVGNMALRYAIGPCCVVQIRAGSCGFKIKSELHAPISVERRAVLLKAFLILAPAAVSRAPDRPIRPRRRVVVRMRILVSCRRVEGECLARRSCRVSLNLANRRTGVSQLAGWMTLDSGLLQIPIEPADSTSNYIGYFLAGDVRIVRP